MSTQQIGMFTNRSCLRIFGWGVFLIFALLFSAVRNASALTIISDFVGGTPQPDAIGTGNLVDIFHTAAGYWEEAILDPHIVTLHFGWAPVGGVSHSLNSQGGTPNRETEGTILFNNDTISGHFQWYLDPTPKLNEEYLSFTEYSDNFGGGTINTGRAFSNPVGAASDDTHYDLLTASLWGIGHALGMSMGNTSFIAESADGDIDVTAPRPLPGTTIPLAFNNYGVTSNFDPFINGRPAMSTGPNGERNILSALDILAIAELSEFNNVNLNPSTNLPEPPANVPEPSTVLLLGSGLVGLGFFRRKKNNN